MDDTDMVEVVNETFLVSSESTPETILETPKTPSQKQTPDKSGNDASGAGPSQPDQSDDTCSHEKKIEIDVKPETPKRQSVEPPSPMRMECLKIECKVAADISNTKAEEGMFNCLSEMIDLSEDYTIQRPEKCVMGGGRRPSSRLGWMPKSKAGKKLTPFPKNDTSGSSAPQSSTKDPPKKKNDICDLLGCHHRPQSQPPDDIHCAQVSRNMVDQPSSSHSHQASVEPVPPQTHVWPWEVDVLETPTLHENVTSRETTVDRAMPEIAEHMEAHTAAPAATSCTSEPLERRSQSQFDLEHHDAPVREHHTQKKQQCSRIVRTLQDGLEFQKHAVNVLLDEPDCDEEAILAHLEEALQRDSLSTCYSGVESAGTATNCVAYAVSKATRRPAF